MGSWAGDANTTGQENVAIGQGAVQSAVAQSNNIGIGYRAGLWETGGSKLFIDSISRGSEASGRAQSLIYGVFSATPANQFVAINGQLEPLALTAGRIVYSAAGTVNAKLTDSANLTYDGSHLQANGYKSSDGSAGVTGSFTDDDGNTVTVKNGLITALT